ncbi:MAG: M48 family metallopeptidase [Caulobacter sp.]|nr:M48 family metallopeptidase [Caulobacter sp.]
MKVPTRSAASLILALFISGCAAPSAVLSPPLVSPGMVEAEAAFELEAVLQRLRQQDQQLSTVTFRLGDAGSGFCKHPGPVSGLVLHHPAQYGSAVRAHANRVFDMGDDLAIMAVAAGSPAEVAGLRPGDRLLAVNGQTFPPVRQPIPRAGSHAPLDQAQRRIASEMRNGPVRLSILRTGVALELRLDPVAHCTTEVQLEISSRVRAMADAERVFVTTAMVRYARNDDELALFVAHELAHVYLGHGGPVSSSSRSRIAIGPGPDGLRRMEAEADYLALYLTARAGYDAEAAPALWRQLGADFPAVREQSRSHPGSLERVAAMRATLEEIREKRAAGLPLWPDRVFKTLSSAPM